MVAFLAIHVLVVAGSDEDVDAIAVPFVLVLVDLRRETVVGLAWLLRGEGRRRLLCGRLLIDVAGGRC